VPEPRLAPSGHTALPGVVDHHVHLGLVDRALLAGSAVVEVHDLGWDPVVAAGWQDRPPAGVSVRFAGRFHTAPGGYPSDRSWAPDGAVRAVTDPTDAAAAVAEAVAYGASAVKIALHTGMPLLPDDVLRALVGAAHGHGLPAVVHAEGEGQAARATDAGADVLVHAPWSERVPDDVLNRGAAMTWISTLAIHGPTTQAVAIDNIRRFLAIGGRVVYGTDMGNGPTPVGVNVPEILALGAAGLTGDDLLDAVLGGPPALVSPHPRPHTASELVVWLGDAQRLKTG